MKYVLVLAVMLMAAGPPPGALPPQPKTHPAGLPANYVMVSPCIAHMGEHWANVKKPLSDSLLYGTYRGKLVFSEVMLTPKDFAAGKSFDNLAALPGHTIDHVNIDYMPHGHPGMPFAHYDIHAFYVSPTAVAAICPDAPMM